MFFDANSLFVSTAGQSAVNAEFEEREEWIDNHNYDPSNLNWCSLDVGNLSRDNALRAYYSVYTVDNLYQYYVFRSLIVNLNLAGRLKNNKAFTLGHYIPFRKGGVHFPCNWIIQTRKENNLAGDTMPRFKDKWTWEKQMGYINAHLPPNLKEPYASRAKEMMRIVKSFY